MQDMEVLKALFLTYSLNRLSFGLYRKLVFNKGVT